MSYKTSSGHWLHIIVIMKGSWEAFQLFYGQRLALEQAGLKNGRNDCESLRANVCALHLAVAPQFAHQNQLWAFPGPTLGDNDSASWRRGLFKPHFNSDHNLRRLVNLENKQSWRSNPLSIPFVIMDLQYNWATSTFLICSLQPMAKFSFSIFMYFLLCP